LKTSSVLSKQKKNHGESELDDTSHSRNGNFQLNHVHGAANVNNSLNVWYKVDTVFKAGWIF